MYYPVCGMMNKKDSLLLIGKSRLAHELMAAGFLSCYLSRPLPYVWWYLTINFVTFLSTFVVFLGEGVQTSLIFFHHFIVCSKTIKYTLKLKVFFNSHFQWPIKQPVVHHNLKIFPPKIKKANNKSKGDHPFVISFVSWIKACVQMVG